MSLDLLKERFGHSVNKKTDDKEIITEKLNNKFNSKGIDDLKSFKSQHRGELEEKERIIENLEIESSNLANEVLTLEKEKSTISEELNNSKWLENNIASTTKKIYEDKIKKMSYVDSSKLIPILIEVSRQKQGNEKLNWGEWLEIAENRYLLQINESIARKIFEDTNVLIDKAISNINRKRTRGGDEPTTEFVNNSSLTFSGDSGAGTSTYVATDFNPDDHSLNLGFTVSYWVRADEVGTRMFAFGRQDENNNERFSFGIDKPSKIHIGVGNNKLTGQWNNGLNDNPGGTAAELFPDLFDSGDLKTGNWLHFVVTYQDRASIAVGSVPRIVYLNGKLVKTTNINWSSTGVDMNGVIFGARRTEGEGYNDGWSCGLDEVAIFDTEKDADWVTSAYNSGTPTDLQNESGLVGYWRFEEGTGTTVEDLSGNGKDGTLTTADTGLPTWSTDTP